jgi:hypothetical protein
MLNHSRLTPCGQGQGAIVIGFLKGFFYQKTYKLIQAVLAKQKQVPFG